MQVYLGNLAPEVDEPLLFELVSSLAPVQSVRMPRKAAGAHQGYGFAGFADPRDGEYVLRLLGAVPVQLHGRAVRARPAARAQQTPAETYVPRLFVGNLAAPDAAGLAVAFEKFGEVTGIEVAGQHAFVQMATRAQAQAALELDGARLLNGVVRVEMER